MTDVTRHAPQACPVCSKTLDAQGSLDVSDLPRRPPQEGDWTVCAGCLTWLAFGPELELRIVTDREWMALSDDERVELTAAQRRVRLAFRADLS